MSPMCCNCILPHKCALLSAVPSASGTHQQSGRPAFSARTPSAHDAVVGAAVVVAGHVTAPEAVAVEQSKHPPWPPWFWYLPGGQSVHAACSTPEYLPASHGEHASSLFEAAVYCPAEHGIHSSTSGGLSVCIMPVPLSHTSMSPHQTYCSAQLIQVAHNTSRHCVSHWPRPLHPVQLFTLLAPLHSAG